MTAIDFRDPVNEGDQLGQIVFQEVTSSTCLQRLATQIIVIVLCHDHHPSIRRGPADRARRRYTIHTFHTDVHNDKVWLVQGVLSHRIVSIARLDELRVQSAENRLDGLAHVWAVVNNLDEHEHCGNVLEEGKAKKEQRKDVDTLKRGGGKHL